MQKLAECLFHCLVSKSISKAQKVSKQSQCADLVLLTGFFPVPTSKLLAVLVELLYWLYCRVPVTE